MLVNLWGHSLCLIITCFQTFHDGFSVILRGTLHRILPPNVDLHCPTPTPASLNSSLPFGALCIPCSFYPSSHFFHGSPFSMAPLPTLIEYEHGVFLKCSRQLSLLPLVSQGAHSQVGFNYNFMLMTPPMASLDQSPRLIPEWQECLQL